MPQTPQVEKHVIAPVEPFKPAANGRLGQTQLQYDKTPSLSPRGSAVGVAGLG